MLIDIKKLWDYRKKQNYSHNLIHCITNPISINDCANVILALGAKPIMAQHPDEVVQISSSAQALALNLGNFDDTRACSMRLSAAYARDHQLPYILDLVGVGCSEIRRCYAQDMIENYHPTIIKGNLSELKAMAHSTSHACGVDVGVDDIEDPKQSAIWLKRMAQNYHCTILCSGETDIIIDETECVLVHNGHPLMALVTGTGCMLNAITATFLSCNAPFESAVLACAYLGCVAEESVLQSPNPGSFHMHLIDWLYAMDEETFYKRINTTIIPIG